MLRLILIILFIYFLYRRFIGRALPKRPPNPPRGPGFRPPPGPSPQHHPLVVDEMVPCARCGIFIPARSAMAKNNLYFCSGQCHEEFFSRGNPR